MIVLGLGIGIGAASSIVLIIYGSLVVVFTAAFAIFSVFSITLAKVTYGQLFGLILICKYCKRVCPKNPTCKSSSLFYVSLCSNCNNKTLHFL
jgi:hypothetical protein